MKKCLVSFFALVALLSSASAQCGDELMKLALSAMGNNQYIKDFDIRMADKSSGTGIMFNVVLNSRTEYQIDIANGAMNKDDIIIQIFDGDKLLGSNYSSGKTFKKFSFICSKTGAYKFHVYCNSNTECCARAVLSLSRQLPLAQMPM